MSSATLQEVIPSAGQSQEIHVGPNSKLVGALVNDGGGATATVQMFFLGTWVAISAGATGNGSLFDFTISGTNYLGLLPAGSRLRIDLTGTFTDATVMLMTS